LKGKNIYTYTITGFSIEILIYGMTFLMKESIRYE